MSICYREDLIYQYRSASYDERKSLYEHYPYMREIFNWIELCEMEEDGERGLY